MCTLDILMVEPSDDGVWKCEVITSFGYATTIAYLHAIGKNLILILEM